MRFFRSEDVKVRLGAGFSCPDNNAPPEAGQIEGNRRRNDAGLSFSSAESAAFLEIEYLVSVFQPLRQFA
jgi:hypothetical protein